MYFLWKDFSYGTIIWPCDLNLSVWSTLKKKTFNICNNFETKRYGFHIAYLYSLWQELSRTSSTIILDLVPLTLNMLKFDTLLKNFNFGNNFQSTTNRAFILHMYTLCGKKPFTWYHILYLFSLTFKFYLPWKNFNIGYKFQSRKDRAFTLQMCFPCNKTFWLYHTFDLVTLICCLTYFWKW